MYNIHIVVVGQLKYTRKKSNIIQYEWTVNYYYYYYVQTSLSPFIIRTQPNEKRRCPKRMRPDDIRVRFAWCTRVHVMYDMFFAPQLFPTHKY